MFTGIIESTARVQSIDSTTRPGIMHITFESSLADQLKVDQSLAHDGVCLTVVKCDNTSYSVDVIDETVKRSNIGDLSAGSRVNLERAMVSGARLDGHMVQGHVDTVGILESIAGEYYNFTCPEEFDALIVHKGSICINGVSLTVTSVAPGRFSVALIPYTLEHTNLGALQTGDRVNLEFDILGKYVQKNLAHFRGAQAD